MTVDINHFIHSELGQSRVITNPGLLYSTCAQLSTYAFKTEQLHSLTEETINRLLKTAHTCHNSYFIDEVKKEAFSIYRKHHKTSEDPKPNVEDDFTQKGIDFYRTFGDELNVLNYTYDYRIDGKAIFKHAKEKCEDKLYNTFYSLADRIDFSHEFTDRMVQAAIRWAAKLAVHSMNQKIWDTYSTEEMISYLAILQKDLIEEYDPSGFLCAVSRPYYLEHDYGSISIENKKEIKINPFNQTFDEKSLYYIRASHPQMFNYISFYQSSLKVNLADEGLSAEEYNLQYQKMLKSIKHAGRRDMMRITFDNQKNTAEIQSCTINHYTSALEVIVHETMHEIQKMAYFAYLKDQEKAKEITGMNDQDHFILLLSDLLKVAVDKNNDDYHKNPGEKQAYFVQDKYRRYFNLITFESRDDRKI